MAEQTVAKWTKNENDIVVKWTKSENNAMNTAFLGTSGKGCMLRSFKTENDMINTGFLGTPGKSCMMRSFSAEKFRPELVPDYVPYYYSAKTDKGTVVYYYTDGYGDSSRDCWAPFFEQKQIEYQRFENLRYSKSKKEVIQD